jgi:hypothetical protein
MLGLPSPGACGRLTWRESVGRLVVESEGKRGGEKGNARGCPANVENVACLYLLYTFYVVTGFVFLRGGVWGLEVKKKEKQSGGLCENIQSLYSFFCYTEI